MGLDRELHSGADKPNTNYIRRNPIPTKAIKTSDQNRFTNTGYNWPRTILVSEKK